MRHKILIALDGSENAMQAVAYAGDVTCACKEFEITLYHVFETPPMFMEHGGTETPAEEKNRQEQLHIDRKKWVEMRRDWVEKEIFEPARQILKEKGVREDTTPVHTKADLKPDVAWSIVQEVEQDGYDTVVLGRRGVSMLREFMFGSVTSKVIHHIKGCAIWVVE